MKENIYEFRPIPGYEGLYSVNLVNQVKSHERIVKRSIGTYMKVKEKLLIPRISHRGYLDVSLCKNSVSKNNSIHRLVALAWNLPKEPHHNVVKHLDNNPSNNHYSNLEWDTQSKNTIDAINDGLVQRSKTHYKTKLTEEDVLNIRNSDLSRVELARKYNVTPCLIGRVRKRIIWKHL